LRVLLVEDSEDDALLLLRELRSGGFEPVHERVDTAKGLADALKNRKWDIVISDYSIPGFGGLEALKIFKKTRLDIPFIIVSGNIGEDIAVEAMKSGAQDYIMKGNLKKLVPAVERELREAESRRMRRAAEERVTVLSNLLNHSSDAICVVDPGSGSFLECNEGASGIFGFGREELLSRAVIDILERLNSPSLWKGHAREVEEKGPILFEDIAKRKSGEKFPVEISAKFVEQGSGSYIVAAVRDITDRKLAEADRLRFTTAIESATDAIVVTDTDWVILYVNSAFEYITGYAWNEAVGQKMSMLRSGKHEECFYEGINKTLRSGKVWSGRITNKRKDGTLYEEDTTISPAKDASGKIVNYVAVKRDVTEKLRLESIAEAVNVMDNIGYVFSGLRHEIGNPINSIKMTLNVLKKNLDKYDREIVMEYIDRALSESSRVEYLLKTMKSFNMFERPEKEMVEAASFIYNFYKLIFGDCMKKGIKAARSVDPDVKFFYADPRALQQVLLNIFTNAMDACEGRENPAIDLTVSRAEDMIRIRISDNGKGIGKKQMDNLFKPFHTSKVKGTGLGLVICKKMLAEMGGVMAINSEEGVGTTVDIFIPEGKACE